jgi:hypothetical protein
MFRADTALRVVLSVREGDEMASLRRAVTDMANEISSLEQEAARYLSRVLAQKSKAWLRLANALAREEEGVDEESEEEGAAGRHTVTNVLLDVEGMEDAMIFVEPSLSEEESYFLEGGGKTYVPLSDTKGLAHLFRSAPEVKREVERVCFAARYGFELHTPSEGVVLVEA